MRERKGYEKMKRIRKIVSALAISGMLATMLAGCTEQNNANTNAKGDTAATSIMQLEDVTQYVEVGEYKGLNITLAADYTVNEELIKSYSDYYFNLAMQYCSDYGEMITDRAIEEGDIAHIDYTGYRDGEPFDRGSTDGMGALLLIGSDSYIDGFEDGLVGVMPGETVDLNLTFPENYGEPDLAGADVVFTVTVNGIVKEEAVARTWGMLYGLDVTTKQEVEDYYRNALTMSARENYETDVENAIVSQLIDLVTVKKEFPGALILTYQGSAQDVLNYYAQTNNTDAETIANQYFGITAQDYVVNESYKQIKFAAVCRYIAEQENLLINDEELNNRAVEYLLDLGYENPGEVLATADMEDFRLTFLQEDVIAYVRSVSNITPSLE